MSGRTHAHPHPEVTVFSTQSCPWCFRVKDFLTSNNISYKDINVGVDEQSAIKMVMRSGQMGVPQLWIGEDVVVGFDQGKIRQLLGL